MLLTHKALIHSSLNTVIFILSIVRKGVKFFVTLQQVQ